MRKTLTAIPVMAAIIMTSCGDSSTSNSGKLTNSKDSLSYAIGLDLGESFVESEITDLNLPLLIKGIQDQIDNSPAFETAEARQFIQEELQRRFEAKSESNKEESKKFMDENKTKEGVEETASGLQYKVITEGTGIKPNTTDTVIVHYEGKLPDGSVFDSSIERGEPTRFPLNRVIPGWTEGLQLMSKGSKYILYVPGELAYGSTPPPGSIIKPYSPLIFEVELIDVIPAVPAN